MAAAGLATRLATHAASLLALARLARAAPVVTCFLIAGCGTGGAPGSAVPGGSAQRGKLALQQRDCGVCHRIPGIRGARGDVGPSLHGYAQRVYVAGKFPHDAAHLVRWIRDAPALAPRTAMPAMGVSEQEARDMAAYLQGLR